MLLSQVWLAVQEAGHFPVDVSFYVHRPASARLGQPAQPRHDHRYHSEVHICQWEVLGGVCNPGRRVAPHVSYWLVLLASVTGVNHWTTA